MNLDALDPSILLPALAAGLLVLSTHVPLGHQVLRRGIVFIDLAIAQIAGLGVIVADQIGFAPQGWATQVAAAAAAAAGALLLTLTEQWWPDVQEAVIGVVFALAACAGLVLLANHPHGGEHLKDLLVGQILWVTPAQLVPVAMLSAAVLVVRGVWGARLGRLGFYLTFALTVTASVQLVGIYLVFASLIVPALGCRHYGPRVRLAAGYLVGAAGYALGLAASALADWPSGPVIVWTLTLSGLAAYVWGPKPPAQPADALHR